MYNTEETTRSRNPDIATTAAQRAVDRSDQAVTTTKDRVRDAAEAVNGGLDKLQESGASALTRAAARADELTRQGMEQARHASHVVREQAQAKGDQAVGYIRHQPVKAILMAAAAGAVLAWIMGRSDRTR